MKYINTVSAILALLITTKPILGEPVPNSAIGEIRSKRVTTKSATLDDSLLSLAKENGLNLIVDARTYSADTQVVSYKRDENKLADTSLFVWKNKLSWLRVSPEISLFWLQPDATKLVHRILTERNWLHNQQVFEGKDGRELLSAELAKYIHEQYGWDGHDDTIFPLEFRINSLTPTLRERVLARMRSGAMTQSIAANEEAWFDDSTWHRTNVALIEPKKAPNSKIPIPPYWLVYARLKDDGNRLIEHDLGFINPQG